MKKSFRILLVVLAVIIFAGVMAVIYFAGGKNFLGTDYSGEQLNALTMENIQIEEKSRKMTSETEGEVSYSVIMPDFAEIYCEAVSKANSKEEVMNIVGKELAKKSCSTVTHEMTARLSIDDGKEVVYSDEALDKLLENVLIDAINEAMEVY